MHCSLKSEIECDVVNVPQQVGKHSETAYLHLQLAVLEKEYVGDGQNAGYRYQYE